MSQSTRSKICAKIQPVLNGRLFLTGWAGKLTFEQVSESIRPRAVTMLLRQYRVWPQDLDDCLQNGLMYLWEQLITDSDFLATASRIEAAIKVCHRSKSTSIRRRNLRCQYLGDFWAKHDIEHPEEMRIGGLERYQIAGEHWATWATLTDIRIDIERAILTIYEQVKDDPPRLLAPYAATTSATSKDLAYVVPGRGEDAIRWRAVEIRDQLRELLQNLRPKQLTWREKYQAVNTEPVMVLLEQYQHQPIRQDAIRGLLEGKSSTQSAKETGHNVNMLQYHRKRANKQLAKAYGCTA